MADISKLQAFCEAYAVAVRGGVVTPCAADEEFFRAHFGLPEMPQEVRDDWAKSRGVRHPITLADKLQTVDPAQGGAP